MTHDTCSCYWIVQWVHYTTPRVVHRESLLVPQTIPGIVVVLKVHGESLLVPKVHGESLLKQLFPFPGSQTTTRNPLTVPPLLHPLLNHYWSLNSHHETTGYSLRIESTLFSGTTGDTFSLLILCFLPYVVYYESIQRELNIRLIIIVWVSVWSKTNPCFFPRSQLRKKKLKKEKTNEKMQ